MVCDRCGSHAHVSDECPDFSSPRPCHADAWMHASGGWGMGPPAAPPADAITLDPLLFSPPHSVIRMTGDGTCLFHSLATWIQRLLHQSCTGPGLRLAAATWLEGNARTTWGSYTVRQWIMAETGLRLPRYIESIRSHRWGGACEIRLISELYKIEIRVYQAA